MLQAAMTKEMDVTPELAAGLASFNSIIEASQGGRTSGLASFALRHQPTGGSLSHAIVDKARIGN
jgi:hypothetical protein